LDALFFRVVFAVAGEGACAAVEEGTGGEVVGPVGPVPVADIVSLAGLNGGVDLRKLAIVSAFILESCLPEPEEVSVPWQKQTAVMDVECVVDMSTR
jgi:hypothetical protein